MRKMELKLKYQNMGSSNSDEELSEFVLMVLRDNQRKRKELLKILKSEHFRQIYKQIRRKKYALKDFILHG